MAMRSDWERVESRLVEATIVTDRFLAIRICREQRATDVVLRGVVRAVHRRTVAMLIVRRHQGRPLVSRGSTTDLGTAQDGRAGNRLLRRSC